MCILWGWQSWCGANSRPETQNQAQALPVAVVRLTLKAMIFPISTSLDQGITAFVSEVSMWDLCEGNGFDREAALGLLVWVSLERREALVATLHPSWTGQREAVSC